VREVVEKLGTRFAISEREVESMSEHMLFKLPASLRAA